MKLFGISEAALNGFAASLIIKVVSLSHLIDFFVPFLVIFPARVTTFCIRGLVFLGISAFREERDTPGVLQSSLSGAEVVYVWQNKDLHLLQVCTENATCETGLFSVKIADEQSLQSSAISVHLQMGIVEARHPTTGRPLKMLKGADCLASHGRHLIGVEI